MILLTIAAFLILGYGWACWSESRTIHPSERALFFGFRMGPLIVIALFAVALSGCASTGGYSAPQQSRIAMDYMEVRNRVRPQDADRYYCTQGRMVAERNGGGRLAIDMTLRCL